MNKELFLADWLKDQNNRGYGRTPLPQVRDEEIAQLIKTWLGLNERDRTEAVSHETEDHSFTLICFGERMASLAVRERNAEHSLLGLLALGIEGGNFDWRENYLIVPLHYDAARRIGADPASIFENAAALLGGHFAKHLRGFLRQPEPEKSIAQMGFRAGEDEHGFRYQRAG